MGQKKGFAKVRIKESVIQKMPLYFNAHTLAVAISVSDDAVQDWINKHGLQAYRQDTGERLIDKFELLEWLRETGRLK